ncbi:acyl-CoA Delta(11) desaturase-like protein [Dinothrombium tinctorium]|uniref:Acyl-CoA Delta(11) desaturase-like protein n=1 Tax=Dinothrombium tinctorium TaxID=1965070 RepID=A0A443QHA7_9ACAR|nr:acyl-CoA Delta(11) desaturase-like protein [Dinothrombium tinctorium]
MAGQNDLYTWCRDHRLHHKYSETDADPHNSNRGFFFSHVGWLLTKKHPDVIIKGKTIDCSDLLNDPVVRFQRKYYPWMFLFFCFFLPTYLCRLIFGNSWKDAFMVGCFGRYIVSLHTTWFVNSAAHMFGDRPFNEKIAARDNLGVALPLWATEGFHNYHHVFPWDYRISEMGFHNYNPFARLIDFFAKIGLACDLKRPSDELIAKVKANAHKEKPHAYDEPHEF